VKFIPVKRVSVVHLARKFATPNAVKIVKKVVGLVNDRRGQVEQVVSTHKGWEPNQLSGQRRMGSQKVGSAIFCDS